MDSSNRLLGSAYPWENDKDIILGRKLLGRWKIFSLLCNSSVSSFAEVVQLIQWIRRLHECRDATNLSKKFSCMCTSLHIENVNLVLLPLAVHPPSSGRPTAKDGGDVEHCPPVPARVILLVYVIKKERAVDSRTLKKT